jgi:acyl-CoA synthetase (NDP forming)
MSADVFEAIFYPKSVAILGASETPGRRGGDMIRRLMTYGYEGKIYPINPQQSQVFGFKAYPSLKSVPDQIDYVIQCVSIEKALGILPECVEKGARVLHIFAGRASETGREDGINLDRQILKKARECGVRLIGPNAFGVHSTELKFCYTGYDFPVTPGPVSGAVQSGGNSTDLIRFGSLQGLSFNKIVSYGNSLDLDESDFLNYFTRDPKTAVIVMYIEGVKNGRKFLSALRGATAVKPVIMVKGGRTRAGSKAASSHTAAMAGSSDVWNTAVRQAGGIVARNLDEMIDLALTFCLLPPLRGNRVGIAGGGGGRGVLSADECEEAGLDVIPLPAQIRAELKQKAPGLWDWVGNPADLTIMKDSEINTGDVLLMMARHPDFDFLLCNVTEDWNSNESELPGQASSEVDSYLEVHKTGLKPMLVVFGNRSLGTEQMDGWRWRLYADLRSKIRNARIPFYPTVGQAARAAMEVINYYSRVKAH